MSAERSGSKIVRGFLIASMALASSGSLAASASSPSKVGEHEAIMCETDQGYLNPDNPEEFTPGVYRDAFGSCPPGNRCYVIVPAVGTCVPSDYSPEKEEIK